MNIHISTNVNRQDSSHISQGIEVKQSSSHGQSVGHAQSKAGEPSQSVVPAQNQGGGASKKHVSVSPALIRAIVFKKSTRGVTGKISDTLRIHPQDTQE